MLILIEDSYNKISKKYGYGGYAKVYYEDRKYLDFINSINKLVDNRENFKNYVLVLVKNDLMDNLTISDIDYKIIM